MVCVFVVRRPLAEVEVVRAVNAGKWLDLALWKCDQLTQINFVSTMWICSKSGEMKILCDFFKISHLDVKTFKSRSIPKCFVMFDGARNGRQFEVDRLRVTNVCVKILFNDFEAVLGILTLWDHWLFINSIDMVYFPCFLGWLKFWQTYFSTGLKPLISWLFIDCYQCPRSVPSWVPIDAASWQTW